MPEREPDLEAVKAARARANTGARAGTGINACLIGEGILSVCADADITFNALHGAIGENGQLQAVFNVNGIKYTGTDYEGSFLAMDKPLAKDLMRIHGIRTPDWSVVDNGACAAGRAETDDMGRDEALRRIGYPCFIKPCGCGSSVGVSCVNNPGEMEAAVNYAFKYEKRILAERKITGREFSVGVLGGQSLPPIEIIPRAGFFDYYNKYQNGATLEICPPLDLSESADKAMRDAALKVHDILRLGDYSRMDVILDDDENVYCLETNTLPGMTPTSLLPKEAAAAGITYPQLCNRIVMLALERYK